MDNRNAPHRGLSRQQRQAIRASKQRRTLIAIALCFALILLMFFILLCDNIITAIRDSRTDLPDDSEQGEQPDDGEQDPEGDQTPDDPDDGNDAPVDPGVTYVNAPAAQAQQGPLILINETHEYMFPSVNNNLINVYDSQSAAKILSKYFQLSGSHLLMDKSAYNAFNKMLTAFFEETGLNTVLITTAYRSYQDQVNTGSSVPAGFSDSHAGLSGALRVFDSNGKTADLSSDPVYNWIYQHCHEYGFIVRYPDGKEALTGVSDYNYYFRYVGYVHAYAMKLNDMCLEEYISYVKGYTNEAPLTVTGEDGTAYEIYYVPAATGGMDTSIPVPTEHAYAISGDNDGGFIITVTLS